MSCRESESLIKSWSTWDLARLAPGQANYLDWFLKGAGSFSEEPIVSQKRNFWYVTARWLQRREILRHVCTRFRLMFVGAKSGFQGQEIIRTENKCFFTFLTTL